jgi:hypothetical protein
MVRSVVERRLDFETWYADLDRVKKSTRSIKKKEAYQSTQDIMNSIYQRVSTMRDSGVSDDDISRHALRLWEKLAYRYRGFIDDVHGEGSYKAVIGNIMNLK